MAKSTKVQLSKQEMTSLLTILEKRFQSNTKRHPDYKWAEIAEGLHDRPQLLWTLHQMEISGGEPDVIQPLVAKAKPLFIDCSAESPVGRRSLCYDRAALDERKENKPLGNVLESASAMGVELLDEEHYRLLQSFGRFDAKTSSWIQTPASIRKLGGALFADFRYDTVFVYHNGAQSYYAARGFRALCRL